MIQKQWRKGSLKHSESTILDKEGIAKQTDVKPP